MTDMDAGVVIHGFRSESEYQETFSPRLRPFMLWLGSLCLISNEEDDFFKKGYKIRRLYVFMIIAVAILLLNMSLEHHLCKSGSLHQAISLYSCVFITKEAK